MPVVYGGMHSVVFIRLSDSATKHSWSDLHLIPETRPTIVLPEPKVQLIEIPGRSKRIDLTDYIPGGMTYGSRSGEFVFYVDHERWDGWKNAFNELSAFFNGDKFAVYLMDNPDFIYEGRVYLSDYSSEDSYSSVTLRYELEPDVVIDGYIHAIFRDSSSYGNDILQDSLIKKGAAPQFYGIYPTHPGYKFDYWSPTPGVISSNTTYTAVYRQINSYWIKFNDWDGTELKSTRVNEGDTPVPPTNPTRIGHYFVDWDSEIVPASANKTYTATYSENADYITGVWEDVEQHLKDGDYNTYYHLGDKIYLNIGDSYDDYVEIVAIDKDIKSDETDDTRVMPLTFITKNVTITPKKFNESSKSYLTHYRYSDLNNYVDSLFASLPSVLQKMIQSVYKYIYASGSSYTSIKSKLWVPSAREIIGGTTYGSLGVTYDDFFNSSASRIKKDKDGNVTSWWLRDNGYRSGSTNYYRVANSNGSHYVNETDARGVAIGFSVCLPSSMQYIIRFYDYNGNTLLKRYWASYNSRPSPPSNPTREGYVFDKWSPDIAYVTDDQDYIAVYKKICNIVFEDYDGTQLLTYTLIEGNKPTRFPSTPSRSGYVFSEWSPDVDYPVFSDKTYIAQYNKLYTITFNDYDGTNLGVYQVPEGDRPTPPNEPTREGYVFDHWNPTISSVAGDKTYVAEYRKLYKVIFEDWNGTVLKEYWSEYGAYPVEPSTDPTRSGYTFNGWSPDLASVNSDIVYAALYTRNPATLTDTWDDVDARIKDGSYSSYYVPGDKIALTVGSVYNDYAQIVGIDADITSDGTVIPLTFITGNCLSTKRPFNSSSTKTGGYPSSDLRTYVNGRKSSFPAKVRSMMKPALKYTQVLRNASSEIAEEVSESLELWVPSYREIFGSNAVEQSGPTYRTVFNSSAKRIKTVSGTASSWWLRTTFATNVDGYTFIIQENGDTNLGYNTNTNGVVIGFCVGSSST